MQLATSNIKKYDITSPSGLLLVITCLASLFAVAYFDSIRVLGVLWLGLEEVSDNSGLLAVVCTCYLLYSKRTKFKQTSPHPNLWAGVVLLIFSLLWFIAKVVDVQSAHLALLPFILLAAIALLLGNRFFQLSLIPILILLFAIPIWWPLLPYLREVTTFATHLNLNLINRPILVDGYVLHLPGGSFLIDESCAGLRFLMVTVLLTFVSADIFEHTLRKFTALLCLGTFLSLIANWIRVLIIVLVGDYTQMQHSLVEDHADLGWVVYGIVVLIPFYLFNHWLSKSYQEPPQSEGKRHKGTVNTPKFLFVVVLTCTLLLSGPILTYSLERYQGPGNTIQAPFALEPAILVNEALGDKETDWRPKFLNASQYLNVRYDLSGRIINTHIVHYQYQQQGAELINVNNVFGDDSRWVEQNGKVLQVIHGLNSDNKLSVQSLEMSGATGQRLLVWYWYDIGGRRSVDPLHAKLLEVVALFSGRTDATLISVSTLCELTCSEANSTLEQFLKVMHPSFSKLL